MMRATSEDVLDTVPQSLLSRWLMTREQLSAVLALFIGWLLSELSHRLHQRSEERKPLARAIADLLEIRHRTRAVTVVLGELKKRFSVPPDAEGVIRKMVQDCIPQTEVLRDRYNEAVDLIAGVDPILAFRLRSKDEFTPLLQKFRALLAADQSGKSLALQIEEKLCTIFLKNLEEVTVELARAHGLRTWWRIRRRFAKPEDISREVADFFSSAEERARATSETATPAE